MEMFLEGLKENKNNKVVHFICRNSKSVLLILIEKISNASSIDIEVIGTAFIFLL